MKLIFLHYAAPPIVGGVERVIYYHATLLAQDGYEVHVIAGRGEQFDETVHFHRREIVDSRHPEILALKDELDRGHVPETFEDARQYILAELQPIIDDGDVLIAHNILGLHKNLALTAALRHVVETQTRPRLIAWHHDLAWKASRYLSEVHAGYPWDLLRQPWPNTRHVAVSEARQLDVAQLFGVPVSEVTVVPGGVDVLSRLSIETSVQKTLRQVGLSGAEPWLLLPARITRRKNIELAIKVTARLQQEALPKVALIVTGPPGPHNPDNANYFAELKALRNKLNLDGAVHFLAEDLGRPTDDELMIALYHLSDALIYPSHEEGFGLPILEAALTRLPIFCSDIPSLRELASGRANYFSPDEEPGKIADLITHVLKADRATMLRRQVVRRFDWQQIVKKHVEPLLNP